MSKEFIRIGGAREHNLKNLTLNIPRDKLVVITGLSGSGKSSLAFDTIYAEGQRKYVESPLRLRPAVPRPDAEAGRGLHRGPLARPSPSSSAAPAPARARSSPPRPRFTITCACSTPTSASRIARKPACPSSRQTTSDIVDKILALPPRTRVMLLAPVVRDQKGEFRDVIERLSREGFVRARVDGELVELASGRPHQAGPQSRSTPSKPSWTGWSLTRRSASGCSDSVETALRWGEGVLLTLHQAPDGGAERRVRSPTAAKPARRRATPQPRRTRRLPPWIETLHSNRNLSPATGKSYEPLTPKHFSFNAPAGACPVCHGLGQKLVFDEGLVVPDPEKSLEQGAILPWRRGGKRMVVYYKGHAARRGAALRAEPGGALQGPAGGFQARAAPGLGRDGDRVHLLARGQDEQGHAPVRRRDPQPGAALPGERKRIHPQPAQGLHEPAVLRRLPGPAAQAGDPGGDAGRCGGACEVQGRVACRRACRDANRAAPRTRTAHSRTTLSLRHPRPLHHGRLRPLGRAGRRVLRHPQAHGVPGEDRARRHQGNPRPAGLPEERRPGLPHAQPRERHA